MPVGRNDLCKCGSGKKFKKCCLNWESTWRHGIENSDCEQTVKSTLIGAFDFIVEKQFQGGCHMISAVLYMLLSEQGVESIIKTGEVGIDEYVFDHSWLEIDGKVFDLTIMNTLDADKKLPPIVMNKSVASGLTTSYKYGVSPNLDVNTQIILAQSIAQYINAGKEHQSYIILESIARNVGIYIQDIDAFLERYMKCYRVRAVEIPRCER